MVSEEDDGTPRIIGKGCSSSMEEDDSAGSLNSDDDKINTMLNTSGGGVDQLPQLICDAKSIKTSGGGMAQYGSQISTNTTTAGKKRKTNEREFVK